MKYVLKPDNRNSSNEELIKDLINVSYMLGKKAITRDEYDKHGRYSEGTLRKRFGGWLKALDTSGLSSTKNYYVSDEQLIGELKRIAKLTNNKVVSRTTFNKYKKLSNTTTIERQFGSWSRALKIAGLIISPSGKRYSNEDYYENLLGVWNHYGKQPAITDINKPPSKITGNSYKNRFGSWRNALDSFIRYMNQGKYIPLKKEQKHKILITKNTYIQHKTSRNVNLRLRFLVMKRDNFKCQKCGRSPSRDPKIILHVDHILPYSKGGETILDNLQTLCSTCNLGKSNLE